MSNPSPTPMQAVANRLQIAFDLHRAGQIERAAAEYSAILQRVPRHPQALRLLGICKLQNDEIDAAVELLRAAAEAAPRDAATHANFGSALARAGDPAAALMSFDRAIALHPNEPGFHMMRADALFALGRASDALTAYDRTIALNPASFEAHNNRGNSLQALGDPLSALKSFDRACALAPDHPAPHNNRASALLELHLAREALESARNALARQPDYADALYNSGAALMDLGRLAESAGQFRKTLECDPRYLKARFNLGIVLGLLSQHAEANAEFGKLLEQRPDYPYALGHLAAMRTYCCSWDGLEEIKAALVQGVDAGRAVSDPFTLLSLFDDPQLQLRCAKQFVADTCRVVAPPLPAPARLPHRRIHIAYVSADFHDHATARLFIEALERHDRSQFELTAVSFGPDDGSAMRARLAKCFDRFVDIRERTDAEAAALMRQWQVDIAVDLKGLTANSRTGIFAQRAAPVQASFLGYPGTLGAPFIDYLIADPFVIADLHRAAYSEHIVYLPHCYQPNDSTRPVPERRITRADAGLPEEAFVFCCFNSMYKITPAVFDVWMRMLQGTRGSVLWLLQDNDTAARNLRAEAQRRGVSPERLVFAPRAPLADHMARHRLADLFLDTAPCNAHTTASDALWAGLPVLTCTGASFVSRVAASLLQAIGLPELVTSSLDEYESAGLKLAREAALLRELATRLERNRATSPLFDANQFRLHLESAYRSMWERCVSGQPPCDIRVPTQSAVTENADGGLAAAAFATIRS